MDFISTYMPAAVDIPTDTIKDTRERLERYARTMWPDLATDPNTVLGDLILTPQAYQLAALELGIDRFMSDLNLGNVAQDNIYNCDFVAEYLKNFATDQTATLKPSGVLRLAFNTDKDYILDRSVLFSIASHTFSIYLPNTGPFTIYKVGSFAVPEGTNGTILKDGGSGVYFADIPVIGNSGALAEGDVTAGTSGSISVVLPELGSISALIDFLPGSEEVTLPVLAQRARQTIYSASLNTRNGAIRYVKDICPFVESIYAIHNGDRELLRDFRNQHGVSAGVLDIYARTPSYAFTETQQVKFLLSADETEFVCENFDYVGQIYHIESITHADAPDVADIPAVVTSTNSLGIGALASYTQYEKLKVVIPNTTDDDGDSIYSISLDDEGRKHTYFVITYQTDPMMPALASTVENTDYRPVNTTLMVRGFIPVIIDRFEVVYARENGVVPLLEEASDRIKEYLAGLGAPNMYSDAVIARIMHEAGVKYMKEVRVRARVQWSVADKIMDYSGNIVDVKNGPQIQDSASLRITYPAPSVQLTADDMYACSPRNIRYYIMEGAVSFNEVKDI